MPPTYYFITKSTLEGKTSSRYFCTRYSSEKFQGLRINQPRASAATAQFITGAATSIGTVDVDTLVEGLRLGKTTSKYIGSLRALAYSKGLNF
jgi:hypothetical protein